jgi:hypothetical protein
LAFCRRDPPVRYEISSNNSSGAGDNDVSSIKTSRKVLSMTGKSGGAPIAAMIASASAGSFAA